MRAFDIIAISYIRQRRILDSPRGRLIIDFRAANNNRGCDAREAGSNRITRGGEKQEEGKFTGQLTRTGSRKRSRSSFFAGVSFSCPLFLGKHDRLCKFRLILCDWNGINVLCADVILWLLSVLSQGFLERRGTRARMNHAGGNLRNANAS